MNLKELGRRAVACKHFYWMPGMLTNEGRRVGEWHPGTVCGTSEPEPPYDGHAYPDLSDPATLGCLLALVEEQHGNVVLNESGGEWECWIYLGNGRGMFQYSGGTRVEALVAALEAAP